MTGETRKHRMHPGWALVTVVGLLAVLGIAARIWQPEGGLEPSAEGAAIMAWPLERADRAVADLLVREDRIRICCPVVSTTPPGEKDGNGPQDGTAQRHSAADALEPSPPKERPAGKAAAEETFAAEGPQTVGKRTGDPRPKAGTPSSGSEDAARDSLSARWTCAEPVLSVVAVAPDEDPAKSGHLLLEGRAAELPEVLTLCGSATERRFLILSRHAPPPSTTPAPVDQDDAAGGAAPSEGEPPAK